MIGKIIRMFSRNADRLRSSLLKTWYRLQYPGLSIDAQTYLAPGVELLCVKGSRMVIHGCTIGKGTQLRSKRTGTLALTGCEIGSYCMLEAMESLEIGPDTLVAERVTIRDQDHRFEANDQKIAEQGFQTAPIRIESNVWIGAEVVILKGVVIGSGIVIGAGSVVSRSLSERAVYAGNPAQKIRDLS